MTPDSSFRPALPGEFAAPAPAFSAACTLAHPRQRPHFSDRC